MRILILTLIGLLFFNKSYSEHIAGGDIDVQWVSGNDYKVTLKLFRDCASGGAGFDNPITITVYDNVADTVVQTFSMNLLSITPIVLGDSCYSPPSSICLEEGLYQTIVTFANNPNGYYLAWERCCRSPVIDNIQINQGMVFYVQVPDPVINNSTPQFGPYPSTGYMCVNTTSVIDFGVTELDGDSLVFSLIAPLVGSLSSMWFSAPNSANPKPYPTILWQPPYNLSDIVGGTPVISIDSQTGIITASPTTTGLYTFAVMIEEYRSGLKISETVRDINYFSLLCTLDPAPDITVVDSINTYVDDAICFDMYVSAANGTDTVYLEVFSSDFDLGGTYIEPSVLGSDLYYLNFQDNDTLWIPHLDSIGNNAYQGIGFVPARYCWASECTDLDSLYHLDLQAYSTSGCSKSDMTNKQVVVNVIHDAAPAIFLGVSDSVNVTIGDQICFDIFVSDTIANDTIAVIPTSDKFDLWGNYLLPDTLNGLYYYTDFFGNDTIWMEYYNVNISANQISAVDTVPLRYCWVPECEALDTTFIVHLEALTTGCGLSDTASKDLIIDVEYSPPPFTLDVPSIIEVNYGENICFDIMAQDQSMTGLTLTVKPTTASFNYTDVYVPPKNIASNSYYTNFMGNDTLWVNNYSYNESEGIVSAIGEVPLRYCWTPSCDEVLEKEYDLSYESSIISCLVHTISQDIKVVVDVPALSVEYPNVFSPNGDGYNDVFTLITENNPCFNSLTATIFNRWGKKVFESSGTFFEWDGKNKEGSNCSEGVYFLILSGSYNGYVKNSNGEKEIISIRENYTISLFR